METKILYRSERNKILAGVCAGLGYYFSIDPTIVRFIFLISALFGGASIFIYLVLWIVMPTESSVVKSVDK